MTVHEEGAGRAWAVSLVAAVLVTVPVWLVTYLPLLDDPFHIARMAILHDIAWGGPMARFSELGSLPIPNLGMDGVMLALTGLMGVEAAGRVFTAAVLALTVAGAASSRARSTAAPG